MKWAELDKLISATVVREMEAADAHRLKMAREYPHFVILYGPDDRPLSLPKRGVGDTVTVRLPERYR